MIFFNPYHISNCLLYPSLYLTDLPMQYMNPNKGTDILINHTDKLCVHYLPPVSDRLFERCLY